MHDRAVEAEKGCDLILVENGAAAKCGQDETASLGASRLLLEPFSHGKIGQSDMHKHGAFQDFSGDQFFVYGDHRTFTVAARGLRHCGRSMCRTDFFPMAITITIS